MQNKSYKDKQNALHDMLIIAFKHFDQNEMFNSRAPLDPNKVVSFWSNVVISGIKSTFANSTLNKEERLEAESDFLKVISNILSNQAERVSEKNIVGRFRVDLSENKSTEE